MLLYKRGYLYFFTTRTYIPLLLYFYYDRFIVIREMFNFYCSVIFYVHLFITTLRSYIFSFSSYYVCVIYQFCFTILKLLKFQVVMLFVCINIDFLSFFSSKNILPVFGIYAIFHLPPYSPYVVQILFSSIFSPHSLNHAL